MAWGRRGVAPPRHHPIASAFPAIVVYGQELLPARVGTVAGLFFGLAFGLGGIGAALIGELADATSIRFVFQLCSFLPLLGLFAGFLPNTKPRVIQIADDAPTLSGGGADR